MRAGDRGGSSPRRFFPPLQRLAVVVLLILGAWSPGAAAPSPGVIPDVAVFLAQSRCANGDLEVEATGCSGARPQRAADPMLTRRRDWPAPAGYQSEDSFQADDGAYFETTFAYPPFGPFNARHGDGGEIYIIDGAGVRIAATEDGGRMNVMQGFYGARCGGTGWILFRNDAPTGRWAEAVARLSDQPLGARCQAKNAAYTRYRLEIVALPFILRGVRKTLSLPTVISEHYNAGTLAQATGLERTFMVKGVGRAVWESWSRKPSSLKDLAQRCPGTAWSTPPTPGWYLNDCRYATNLVPADGSLTGDGYGWPVSGLTWP